MFAFRACSGSGSGSSGSSSGGSSSSNGSELKGLLLKNELKKLVHHQRGEKIVIP